MYNNDGFFRRKSHTNSIIKKSIFYVVVIHLQTQIVYIIKYYFR